MLRSVELKLDLPVVLPLLAMIREQVVDLSQEGDVRTEKPGSRRMRSPHLTQFKPRPVLADLQVLLDLFPPYFPTTGRIHISEGEAPAVLRACAFLRLELRERHLSAIPDATIESNLVPKDYLGDEHRAVMCFLFLATIQVSILTNLPFRSPLSIAAIKRWVGRLLSRFDNNWSVSSGNSGQSNGFAAEPWQVSVLNDAVNLMAYVTRVFESELGIPTEIAEKHMREVHEQKMSVVWEGPHDQVEDISEALRSWHLDVSIKRKSAASGE